VAAETKIKITGDTSQVERAIANLESSLEGLKATSSAVGKALAGLTAVGAAVGFAFKSVTDQVGDLADLGKALGLTAQGLDALQKSARLAGIDAGELNAALFRLQGNLGDALVKGTGPAKDALDSLGISVREISRLPADQQIAKITAELRRVEDPAKRSALAIDLLGKQGPRMLEVAENAARIAEQAERMGIALSDVDVRALEQAGDAMDELAFIAGDTLRKAMAQLAPYAIALANAIKQSIENAGGLDSIIINRVIPAIKLAAQAMAILASMFVAAKLASGIIAATTAMLKMYQAIKVASSAAGVLNAVLGKNPILKILGAVAAVAGAVVAVDAVNDAFDTLDQEAKKVLSDINAELAEQGSLINQNTQAVNEYNQAQKKALETLNDNIAKLQQSAQFERDKLSLGEAQANINKMIAEESDKLAKVGLTLTDQQRTRITNAYQELEAVKQQSQLTKIIRDLEIEQTTAVIANKDQREIATAILKQQAEFGRALTDSEKERLTTAIKLTQQAREQGQIAEAIYNYTRQQTELEKLNRGINLQSTLNPMGAAAKTYQQDEEALKAMLDRKLISEQEYYDQRSRLAENYSMKVMELESQEFQNFNKLTDMKIQREAERHAASLRNERDFLGGKMFSEETIKQIAADRAAFEKKTDLDKTKFAIDNLQSVFAALGAQNKKAFEAQKALAIASALVNTYQGATKALATYPWPFGLIAAAAAVAAGLAQVSAIRSQQYSGRALGGPVMGGTPYLVGENGPELFTPNTTGSITRNNQLGQSQPVNVNFTIVANDTTGFDQLLTSRKGVITQIISDAMLERGQRSSV